MPHTPPPGDRPADTTQVPLKAPPHCAEMVSDSREFVRREGTASRCSSGPQPTLPPFVALSLEHKQALPAFTVKSVKSYSLASSALSLKREKNHHLQITFITLDRGRRLASLHSAWAPGSSWPPAAFVPHWLLRIFPS